MFATTHPMMQQVMAKELEARAGFAGYDHNQPLPRGAQTEQMLAQQRAEGLRPNTKEEKSVLAWFRQLFTDRPAKGDFRAA